MHRECHYGVPLSKHNMVLGEVRKTGRYRVCFFTARSSRMG